MHRRFVIPALVLAALTVLTAGAVVLGLVQAPATPDLTVHNGAGEIGYASSVTYMEYASVTPREVYRIAFQAPDRVTETFLLDGRPVRSIHVTRPSVRTQALAPFTFVGRLTGFSVQGSSFTVSHPVRSGLVRGTVTYSTQVSGGYLTALTARSRYTTSAGVRTASERIQVTSINDQPAP